MSETFTLRNHYNPCFWTALWNTTYFESWVAGEKPRGDPRDQVVFALHLQADKILPTKVEGVHYDKNLGVAEVTPASMKRFCKRWYPMEYDALARDIDQNPESLYIDFEDILTGIERTAAYDAVMQAARIGGVASPEHKGFLACALVLHAMRSHELMASMIGATPARGLEKWEYFWLLKNAWSNPLVLGRATIPLARGQWTFYRTDAHRFPLCDSPVMIGQNTVMATLSPRLLLEINLNVAASEDSWVVREGISSSKYREFRRRSIGNSFKAIIFHERSTLTEWRSTPEFKRRVDAHRSGAAVQLTNEAAARVVWAVNGFGRVPDDFEQWAG